MIPVDSTERGTASRKWQRPRTFSDEAMSNDHSRHHRAPPAGVLLVSIDQIAALFGVGRRTAYVLRERPDFPKPVRLGERTVRYRASDVHRFVEQLAAEAVPAAEPDRLSRGRARYLSLTLQERAAQTAERRTERAAGRSAGRASAGGSDGGTQAPVNGKPRQEPAGAERSGFEPRVRVRE